MASISSPVPHLMTLSFFSPSLHSHFSTNQLLLARLSFNPFIQLLQNASEICKMKTFSHNCHAVLALAHFTLSANVLEYIDYTYIHNTYVHIHIHTYACTLYIIHYDTLLIYEEQFLSETVLHIHTPFYS